MATVKPFKGITPKKELAPDVASLPYDVMNRQEAKQMASGNPVSFLHIVRSEIDMPDDLSPYDESVYLKARQNLDDFIAKGVLETTSEPCFYIYRQLMKGRVQTGLVAVTSIDEYLDNTIKKHEFTRPAKEQDRINNFDYCDANTAPIFLTYRMDKTIQNIINQWIKFHSPDIEFKSKDDILHIIWKIDDSNVVNDIEQAFKNIDYLYIADGHHRSASAVKVGQKRRAENPNYSGDEAYNFFMSVLFPDEDLFIMDYNRVVKDLNGLDEDQFIETLGMSFDIEEASETPYKPTERANFGMYLSGKWYKLKAKSQAVDMDDPIKRLDVSILQDKVLNPILGIQDPRTDDRIDFIGGIRGLSELIEKVDKGDFKVAFAMYPTTMADLMAIADAGEVMPPKSTWFEPKLRSGLFVHRLK